MGKTITQPHSLLRLLIRAKAPSENGFQLTDAKGMEAEHYASRHACRMVLAGELFRCKVKGHAIHYLDSKKQADKLTAKLLAHNALEKTMPPRLKKIKAVKAVKVRAVKAIKLAKPAKPEKVKLVKLVKPIKPPTPIKVRKPYVPPAPRIDPEIIHTAQTRYISRMMPAPRNQVITYSFVHGGMGAMR